jgi:hypothetical protein
MNSSGNGFRQSLRPVKLAVALSPPQRFTDAVPGTE